MERALYRNLWYYTRKKQAAKCEQKLQQGQMKMKLSWRMIEIFFSRLLAICEKHGINLSDVSQFYLNGTVFKTVKPKLFDEIEKDLQHHSMPVSSGAYIYIW